MILGDINYDMLSEHKGAPLKNVCDIFDFVNLVKSPTCFTKGAPATLNDVILTNRSTLCQNIQNFNCGLSDVHNIISVQIKGTIPRINKKFVEYRSFKNFDQEFFLNDLEQKNLNSIVDKCDNVNSAYENFESEFISVINKHAPMKKKKPVDKPVPFMNKNLKRAIYKKRMSFNKYNRCKNKQNWEIYRKQRNLVNKIKKQSIRNYFIERCAGGPKSKHFWPTIKPFLTNKGSHFAKDIILCENDNIINNQTEVAETFNNFFINVAKDIGSQNIKTDDNHPSIKAIKENKTETDQFIFNPINEEFVNKEINKIGIKKATGKDGISSKILRLSKSVVAKPISKIINKSFETSTFPDKLKEAQVVPLHKKNNTLDKGNYRPVSILPMISKIFERAVNSQIVEFFDSHFHTFLSAFRKGYGCQTALLKVIEDWKKALDQNKYVAAILMNLSKAFDCLPHDLLILKLKTYGVSPSALNLIDSYLKNRKQCVKVGPHISNWQDIYKGVPQGSILGPILFKIFLNDIFYFIKNSDLYNYADDNTLSYSDHDINKVISTLEDDSMTLINWFSINKMKANPEKFQAIAIGKQTKQQNLTFTLDGNKIECESEVKLLGVTIDFQLNFNEHVSNICKKASRQLNVLKRIGTHLTKLGKLTIYYSFIMSNFNYCPLVWHFCGETNTKKIEKIQERALRFIYNEYTSSYEDLLCKSKLPSLKVRRLRTFALEVFKIVNKDCPVYLFDLIDIKNTSYSFRYQNKAALPQVRTTSFGLQSFRYAGAKLWNELPDHFRKDMSLDQFKNLINTWSGSSCHCFACKASV